MADFNEKIIAEFRANGGRVETLGFGTNLVLLHTFGAQSGTERVNPVRALRDGDGWLIAASAGGAARDPDWAHNLRELPSTVIETGTETVAVVATELGGAPYKAAWERLVEASSAFADYQERARGRRIPVMRLRRSTAAD